ncbi:MAG TPA: prolyl oligopeptidase family serine peptidase [Actinomycetes bacterium]|jgi:dipeptidyl aminopeptidase/acylaminoacyl peptidase|nr:prolyl oligopeptidase family serine peptidase [Actinomycetes bacterium]
MPYGSWPSPITAELVASRSTAYDAVQMTDRAVYWLEGRPWEDGRTVVVQWTAQEGRVDAVPPGFNVGTRVHEYGGGAYLVAGTTLLVSRLDDQRLYRLDEGRPPRPITPAPAIPATIRYADARLTADRRLLICVRERHQEGEVINELAALPSDGSAAPWVVAGGRDFYAAPRPSPDGRRLAWVTWDRPSMPWDGTDLWVADLTADGRLGPARHVAGGPAESIVQPEWHPDGTLHFISDRSGWWNLYRHRNDRTEALLPMQAEFADAPWELDYATYAFLADGRLACRYHQDGTDHLALLDPRTGRLEDLRSPFTSIKPYLRAVNDRIALIGASPTHYQTVATVDLASGRVEVLAGTDIAVDRGYVSVPRAIWFPTVGGQTAHALYYPPTSKDVTGPDGQQPPLLVQPHPGPTANAKARLDLRTQFFTSRGFAVVDVNYGGSTGLGRAYRERLTGQWGVVDVDDCLAAARYLVEAGRADPEGLLIAGASAGGYTALCALAFRDLFTAGASYFGIADLETFRHKAPKFQAHYLDRLVGPYPEQADTYRARSPLHAADRIACPVILLQGLDDTIVPPAQSEAMAQTLDRKRIPHVYLMFPGEGHGFRRAESIRHALREEAAFYRRTLAERR